MSVPWKTTDEALVAEFGPAVYRLAFAQLRSRADAEDVYQEVFLRCVAKRPVWESPEHARAWLLRVTLNCCRDVWRAPWRRHNVPLTDDLPFEAPEELDLHEKLRKLPKKYRAVLHLFYWEDLPTAEIARVLGCTPDAVRQRLSRGREQLKKILQEEENVHVGKDI